MPLTIQEFHTGVHFWRGKNWPQDYHNAFYQQLELLNGAGMFNEDWWCQLLPHLRRWVATRPKSYAYLTQRAQERFNQLAIDWDTIINRPNSNDIAAQGLNWKVCAPFASIVAEIKNVESPVFTSKMCHFISPNRFPVIDNAAMGLPVNNYGLYWNSIREEWLQTNKDTRTQLQTELIEEIGVEPYPDYPYVCKIAEICLIGRYNG